MTIRSAPIGRAGMTLVEMLVALVVFLIVMAGAIRLMVSESQGYRTGSEEMSIAQNVRFGVEQLGAQIRSAGGNTAEGQPEVIYAGADAFAFNADYVSNVANDLSAAYIDPDAPAQQVISLPLARAVTISGSSPAFTYPLANYGGATAASAETITFYFEGDTATARADDFALWRRVNDQVPELVIRNVLRSPGFPFFGYQRLARNGANELTLDTIPTAWQPLRHSAAVHNSVADTGAARRIDSLRTVRLSYTVTNGYTDERERMRPISVVIPLPNLGLAKLKSCGDEPMHGQFLTATPGVSVDDVPFVELNWAQAVDESGGESDVMRYVIWRRLQADPDWGTPYVSLPSGNPTYAYTDADVAAGQTYVYAVAAQDCTPSLSTKSVSAATLVPVVVVP